MFDPLLRVYSQTLEKDKPRFYPLLAHFLEKLSLASAEDCAQLLSLPQGLSPRVVARVLTHFLTPSVLGEASISTCLTALNACASLNKPKRIANTLLSQLLNPTLLRKASDKHCLDILSACVRLRLNQAPLLSVVDRLLEQRDPFHYATNYSFLSTCLQLRLHDKRLLDLLRPIDYIFPGLLQPHHSPHWMINIKLIMRYDINTINKLSFFEYIQTRLFILSDLYENNWSHSSRTKRLSYENSFDLRLHLSIFRMITSWYIVTKNTLSLPSQSIDVIALTFCLKKLFTHFPIPSEELAGDYWFIFAAYFYGDLYDYLSILSNNISMGFFSKLTRFLEKKPRHIHDSAEKSDLLNKIQRFLIKQGYTVQRSVYKGALLIDLLVNQCAICIEEPFFTKENEQSVLSMENQAQDILLEKMGISVIRFHFKTLRTLDRASLKAYLKDNLLPYLELPKLLERVSPLAPQGPAELAIKEPFFVFFHLLDQPVREAQEEACCLYQANRHTLSIENKRALLFYLINSLENHVMPGVQLELLEAIFLDWPDEIMHEKGELLIRTILSLLTQSNIELHDGLTRLYQKNKAALSPSSKVTFVMSLAKSAQRSSCYDTQKWLITEVFTGWPDKTYLDISVQDCLELLNSFNTSFVQWYFNNITLRLLEYLSLPQQINQIYSPDLVSILTTYYERLKTKPQLIDRFLKRFFNLLSLSHIDDYIKLFLLGEAVINHKAMTPILTHFCLTIAPRASYQDCMKALNTYTKNIFNDFARSSTVANEENRVVQALINRLLDPDILSQATLEGCMSILSICAKLESIQLYYCLIRLPGYVKVELRKKELLHVLDRLFEMRSLKSNLDHDDQDQKDIIFFCNTLRLPVPEASKEGNKRQSPASSPEHSPLQKASIFQANPQKKRGCRICPPCTLL